MRRGMMQSGGNKEPNFFIKGLSLSTKELLKDEIDRISSTTISLSNILKFNYDAVNDESSAFVRSSINITNNCYQNNDNLESIVDYTKGNFFTLYQFSLANYVTEIIMPNKTFNNLGSVANTFVIRCARLETLIIPNVKRLTHNFLYSAPLLTTLDVSEVVYADTKSIRSVGNLDLIDMKKCKVLGEDAREGGVIFPGLKSNVTINLNAFLMTDTLGGLNPHVSLLKTTYPNSTINFYTDSGVYVDTL